MDPPDPQSRISDYALTVRNCAIRPCDGSRPPAISRNRCRQSSESAPDEPQSYLAEVITKIVDGHPNSQIDDLLPWAYAPSAELKAVA